MGGAHGIARILEDALQKFLDPVRKTRIGRILCAVLVFVFCNAAWVFFRAESFADAAYVFSHVFDGIGDPWNYLQSSFLSPMELAGILVYIAVLAVYDCLNYHGNAMNKINSLHKVWQWGIWLGLGLVVVFCSRKGEAAEFVYFQF